MARSNVGRALVYRFRATAFSPLPFPPLLFFLFISVLLPPSSSDVILARLGRKGLATLDCLYGSIDDLEGPLLYCGVMLPREI